MKPAFSVIFFTVGSGAGLGLFALLVLADLFGFGLGSGAIAGAGLFALALTAAGLMSSTLHLANPKNAWRAVSRFRTSWLSREGVFAIIFFPVALGYLVAVYLGADWSVRAALGLAGVALAWTVIFCTGMIYACLKTIPQWRTALTPINYLALAHFSGSLLLLVVAEATGANRGPSLVLALELLVVAVVFKGIYFYRFRVTPGRHTLAGALGSATIAAAKLLDAGHSHGTFLTREFGFSLARAHAVNLRYVVLVAAFLVPLVALVVGVRGVTTIGLVALISIAGLLVERWLFFAEAQHVVRLYHGQRRV